MENRNKRELYKKIKKISLTLIVVLLFAYLGLIFYMIWLQGNIFSLGDFQSKFNAVKYQMYLMRYGSLIIILIIFFVVVFIYSTNKYRQLDSGIVGEEKTQNILDRLPNNYVVLNNVSIHDEGKESEIDSLVISSRGLVIIESKNYVGQISGNVDSQIWSQTKISGRGHKYVNEIKNPIKQMNRQVYILSQMLKKYGVNCWIDGFVYMTGGQCDVISDKVINSERTLLNSILNSGKENALSESEINKILNCLKTNEIF